MWDVAESTGDALTSKRTSDTILAKYFADFVNEEGTMKLVEDAKVTVSGAVTSAIGANQIMIEATGLSAFIDAEKAPRKDKEEVTYKASATEVVAYVPANVANIANMAGKTVDVIFGKDNVVAYLVVTDDTTDAAYVTAFDAEDKEIEIDGTTYEIANDVVVNVFNYEVGTGISAITTLLKTNLGITNPAKYMTRNVIAETILNPDDEVESINFKFSAAYDITLVADDTDTADVDDDDMYWFWVDAKGKVLKATASDSDATEQKFYAENDVHAKAATAYTAVYGKTKEINGKDYIFNQNGEMLSGLVDVDGNLFYYGKSSDGSMKTGEVVLADAKEEDDYNFYFAKTKKEGYVTEGSAVTGAAAGKLYNNGILVKNTTDFDYTEVEVGGYHWIIDDNGNIKTSKKEYKALNDVTDEKETYLNTEEITFEKEAGRLKGSYSKDITAVVE